MKEILKKFKKSRIFSLICILLFIGICFGIGASIAYVQHEANPTDEAVKYFRAFAQQDYEKMYECLYQEKGYYIEKDMYVKEMKNLRERYTIDSYDIKEPATKGGKQSVTVKCKNETSNETKEFVVYIKSVRHGIQMIPDYYVDIENMMAKEVDITIPKNDKLQLNGNLIDKNTTDIEEEKDNSKYHFTGILEGKYNVSASNDIYARNKTITVGGENVEIDLSKEKLTANEKYTKLITNNGKKIINQFYKATRNRDTKNKTLQKMFASKKTRKKVSKLVEESQDIIFWPEKRNVDNFKVLDMKIKDLKNTISYSKKTKHYTIVYKYKYKYVSSTDTSLANSYVDKISGTCHCTLTIMYSVDGNKLTVKDIKLKNHNKKN